MPVDLTPEEESLILKLAQADIDSSKQFLDDRVRISLEQFDRPDVKGLYLHNIVINFSANIVASLAMNHGWPIDDTLEEICKLSRQHVLGHQRRN